MRNRETAYYSSDFAISSSCTYQIFRLIDERAGKRERVTSVCPFFDQGAIIPDGKETGSLQIWFHRFRDLLSLSAIGLHTRSGIGMPQESVSSFTLHSIRTDGRESTHFSHK